MRIEADCGDIDDLVLCRAPAPVMEKLSDRERAALFRLACEIEEGWCKRAQEEKEATEQREMVRSRDSAAACRRDYSDLGRSSRPPGESGVFVSGDVAAIDPLHPLVKSIESALGVGLEAIRRCIYAKGFEADGSRPERAVKVQ